MYTMVIVNPASAAGATGRRWPELRAALDRVLGRWDHAFTLKPGDATEIARRAVGEGYEMIVSIGGDGTNNEVVSGLVDPSGALLRSDLVLGLVRQGTGGDFARFLGLPGRLPASVAHLAGSATRAADLGWIEFQAENGQTHGRAFLNIASFGLSGEVDAQVNRSSKALGGRISFLAGTLRALAGYRPQNVSVFVDDTLFFEGPMVTTAVANGQYFGGGMRFARDAQIDDGQFDVVVQTAAGMREIVRLPEVYSGAMADWTTVRVRRGRQVRAQSDERVRLDVDGEQPGFLPALFRVIPSALRLKVE